MGQIVVNYLKKNELLLILKNKLCTYLHSLQLTREDNDDLNDSRRIRFQYLEIQFSERLCLVGSIPQ